MSAAALQRVVVRMLYDPALVAAVYADADAALAGEDLAAAERAWLTTADRRRWAADPMRRYRGLQAVLEEYPVSGALAIRAGGVAAVDAFFSSAIFHGAIQRRRSLALAFGDWLDHPLAPLERAIAAVRRAPPPRASRGPRWQAAPWIAALTLPEGGLAAWQATRARIEAHPDGAMVAVVSDTPLPTPRFGGEREGLIIEPGPAIGGGALPLVALLQALASPLDETDAHRAACDAGAEPADAAELLDDLCADGLLIRVP